MRLWSFPYRKYILTEHTYGIAYRPSQHPLLLTHIYHLWNRSRSSLVLGKASFLNHRKKIGLRHEQEQWGPKAIFSTAKSVIEIVYLPPAAPHGLSQSKCSLLDTILANVEFVKGNAWKRSLVEASWSLCPFQAPWIVFHSTRLVQEPDRLGEVLSFH